MAERKFSCIKQVVKTVQIPLPATFISNETSGIAEILDSWKRQYLKQLQGVVVNYKHYSLSSPTGFITPNRPFVYYNVKATFDLFCPKVGDVVKGKINRISKEHIGCLIEDTINVTIHLSKDSPEELAPFICLNYDILFEISSFNFDRKIIRVTGKITPKCIQLMRDLFPPQTLSHFVDTPELSNNTDEGIGTSSESADDRLLNQNFDDMRSNDEDVNFKKPLSSVTKSKKKSSKRPKSDSESSSMDTSDVSTSDEKSKKKKKKHKSNPDIGNHPSGDNPSSDPVSCDMLIQNFSSIDYSGVLEAIKEEESPVEGNTHVKRKKKQKPDLSPSFLGKSTKSNNHSLIENVSSLDLNTSTVIEKSKSSKKRKRESESFDTSEQSTADEMPKKKKKCKDNTVPVEEKEIKIELPDMNFSTIIKKEISSPVKSVDNNVLENTDNTVPERKKNKKNKYKKHKEKDKPKKIKIHATGAILKKDKKSQKSSLKKNVEKSKKHKKAKSHKKDEKGKKKKKDSSKNEVSNVIKFEID